MRTTDFSQAPDIGQATAQFVGATCFSGPLQLIELYRRWRHLVKRLKRSPGYRGHRVWYRFPFTLGTIAFFADRNTLLTFARSQEHASIMRWVMQPGNARGGFIRFYEVLPHGYSSGIWRTEDHEMKAIERFTPLSGETSDGVPSVVERAGNAR